MARSGMSPRMLVIGLDAADPSLIEKWSADGVLPTLKRLRSEGYWVKLRHTGEFTSSSIWPSIYTGTHLGKHGFYHTTQIGPGTKELGLLKPERCGQSPFWRDLDKSGRHSIVVDVPFSYPRADLNGIQISDWGSYERFSEPRSTSREVLTEIDRRFGRYPVGQEMSRNAPVGKRELQRRRTQLLAGAALKGNLIKWLMSNRPWDFFMVVFGETHAAGHSFWNFGSNNHHDSFDSKALNLTTTLRDIYRAVDGEISKLVEMLDERTSVLVLSGHGMRPNYAGWHLIPEVLSRLGLLVTGSKTSGNGIRAPERSQQLRSLLPLNWRRSLSRYLPNRLRDYLTIHWATSGIDWAQTRAFCLPTERLGFIRINLKGREPNGIVEPGLEYQNLCDQICDTLKQLVHPRTGRPIVGEVFYTDHVFPGPQRDCLPDLIVDWRHEGEIDETCSRQVGTVKASSPDLRYASHSPEGFAVLYGRGIGRGYASTGHILDVAPTVLTYFGLQPPSYMDGQAWANPFGL